MKQFGYLDALSMKVADIEGDVKDIRLDLMYWASSEEESWRIGQSLEKLEEHLDKLKKLLECI